MLASLAAMSGARPFLMKASIDTKTSALEERG
jgi:hypothetical protein